MISITTPTFDLQGQVIINETANSDLKKNNKRISRTATLDGGCSITDQGFSNADRTLTINESSLDKERADCIWRIFTIYSLVRVSLRDGCFLGAIEKVSLNEGNLNMKILIKERLNYGY